MTLAEYVARGAEKDRLPPVLAVPEGATLRLRITPKSCPGREFKVMLDEEVELTTPTDDIVVSVRATKAFHLDLMHLLISKDREKWSLMWFNVGVFAHRVSELTLAEGAATTTLSVEAGFFATIEPAGHPR
jgi:hypothetical protein